MRTRPFGSTGIDVPIVGQGTWPIPGREALLRGIELGMTHIDTAEMYGEGRSEEIIGEALAGIRRSSLFLVSKVLPSNATVKKMAKSCEQSLKRLRTDYLDCYLLHWHGSADLDEAMAGLEALLDAGKIRSLGVSNLDSDELAESQRALHGARIVCDQVLYNLSERTPELHEFGWAKKSAAAIVAYTPLARPKTRSGETVLTEIAKAHEVTKEAVALAFLAREPFAFVIPKAKSIEHVEANAAAGELMLSADEIAAIDSAFAAQARHGALPTA